MIGHFPAFVDVVGVVFANGSEVPVVAVFVGVAFGLGVVCWFVDSVDFPSRYFVDPFPARLPRMWRRRPFPRLFAWPSRMLFVAVAVFVVPVVRVVDLVVVVGRLPVFELVVVFVFVVVAVVVAFAYHAVVVVVACRLPGSCCLLLSAGVLPSSSPCFLVGFLRCLLLSSGTSPPSPVALCPDRWMRCRCRCDRC